MGRSQPGKARRNNKNKDKSDNNGTASGTGAAATPLTEDPWHNADSPSCQRLYQIVRQELALSPQVRQDGTSATSTAAAAAAATTQPSPSPGFATLVRDYLLWVRQSSTSSSMVDASTNKSKASKKKRKKKKKKKAGSLDGGDQDEIINPPPPTKGADDEEEKDATAGASTAGTESEKSASNQTTTTLTGATEKQNGGGDSNGDNHASNDTAGNHVKPTGGPNHTLSSSKPQSSKQALTIEDPELRKAWIDQRLQRRRAWVDRFLDYCCKKQQQQDDETEKGDSGSSAAAAAAAAAVAPTKRPSPEHTREKMDQFLAWLSQNMLAKQQGTESSTAENPNKNNRKINRRDTDSQASSSVAPQSGLSVFKGKDTEAAVSVIECVECKRIVGRRLHNSFVLSGNLDIDEPRSNFQYVAMEEGNGRAMSPHALTFVAPENATAAWRLERLDGSPAVLTREALELWLLEYVVLGGLGYDEVVLGPTNTKFTEEQLKTVFERTQAAGKDLSTEFNQCASTMHVQITKIQQISDKGESFDMKSSRTMFEIESELSALMERLLRVTLDVTRTYQRVALYLTHAARRTGQPQPVVSSMFLDDNTGIGSVVLDFFLERMRLVFDTMSGHEEKFLALVDGQGQIPPLFYNLHSRRTLKSLLNAKFQIIWGSFERMMKMLDERNYTDLVETVATIFNPSYFRILRGVDELLREALPDYPARKTILDEACEDVMYLLHEWSDYVKQQFVEKLLFEHNQRRVKLADALDRADQVFQQFMANIRDDHPEAETIALLYSEWESHDIDGVTIKDFPTLDDVRKKFLSKTHSMIRLWTKLSANRPVEPASFPSKLVVMPLQLIESITYGRRPEFRCNFGSECRAGCILSGLLFDWMAQQYTEWQAEIAGQELLTTVGTGDAVVGTWSDVTKGSKKAPKKKEKKGAPNQKPAETSPVPAATGSAPAASEDDTSDDDILIASIANRKLEDEPTAKKIATGKVRQTGLAKEDIEAASPPISEQSSGRSFPALDVGASQGNGANIDKVTTSPSRDDKPSGPVDVPPKTKDADKDHDKLSKVKSTKTTTSSEPGLDQAKSKAQLNEGRTKKEVRAPLSSSEKPLSLDIDSMIMVGVYDQENRIQSAEEFLLGRYLEIVKKIESPKTEVVQIL